MGKRLYRGSSTIVAELVSVGAQANSPVAFLRSFLVNLNIKPCG